MKEKPEGVNCFRCRHFYITWDRKFPRGCKAMGFKGKELPCRVVQQTSGEECLKFEEKREGTGPDPAETSDSDDQGQ